MQKTDRIVVIGADWYGGWAKDFYLALKELGCQAELIYTNSVPFSTAGSASSALTLERIKTFLRKMGRFVFSTVKQLRNYLGEKRLLKNLSRFDLTKESVTIISIWTPLSPNVLASLKAKGVCLVLWQGESANCDKEWNKAFPYYDYIFIVEDDWTKDSEDESIRARTKLLPLATNPHTYRPMPPDRVVPDKCRSDISFIGLYRRERAQILSVIKDFGLKVYGSGWEAGFEEFPWLKNQYKGMLSEDEAMMVFNNAKISIGSLGCYFNPGPQIAQRVFNISASKRFQLSQYNHLSPQFFGDSVITFNSVEELRAKTEYYLDHPEERDRLAVEAYNITLRDHTYLARAKTLLSVCGISLPDQSKQSMLTE